MKKLLAIAMSNVCPAQLEMAAKTAVNVPLMRVYGEARNLQPGRRGQITILGDFRAVNSTTGEEFSSSVIYLPSGLQETLIVGMEDGNAIVRFAYDIWAEPDPKGKSYNIGFSDLLEKPDAVDPLAKIFGDLPPMDIPGKTKAK